MHFGSQATRFHFDTLIITWKYFYRTFRIKNITMEYENKNKNHSSVISNNSFTLYLRTRKKHVWINNKSRNSYADKIVSPQAEMLNSNVIE